MSDNLTFQQALRSKDFVLSAQLQLNEETGRRGVIAQAKSLFEVVDGVAVPANPHGLVHMAGLAASALLLEEGIDPVLHIASRDRNRISIRSELLGAAALGVTSLFLERGDRVSRAVRPRAKTSKPSKVGSVKMLAVAKRLSDYQVEQGNSELMLGTLATVVEPSSDWEPHGLNSKVNAGAKFLKSRVCCDADLARRYVTELVESKFVQRCRVIISIPVLPSVEAAEWINEHRQTEVIPVSVMRRLAAASSPVDEGIKIATELLLELKTIPGVSGANLITSGEVESIPAVIAAAS